ncbi:MAG: hypothetical protein ABSA76_06220 [Bacteroidales bacterium]
MKKLLILLALIPIGFRSYAPEFHRIYLTANSGINLYERIFKAVVQFESGGDQWAYNVKENAVGCAQIRQIRIKDYNIRTGKNYKLREMFDAGKSKEVFMYYCKMIQDPDKIIKRWNGSGPQTLIYLNKIKDLI